MTGRLPPLSANAWLRWDVVSRMLPEDARDVLEIGCGRGAVGARLAQRYRYLGLEPDRCSYEAAAAAIRDSNKHGEVRHGHIAALDPDENFDLVCSFEVIEHIADDADAVASWAEHLRPGGMLILTTPAWQRRMGPADKAVGHIRRYDPDDMRELLASAGLDSVGVQLYGMPLGYVLEATRNVMARRRLREDQPVAERTASSGRWLQPERRIAGMTLAAGTAPFRLVQRWFTGTGQSLLAWGHRPVA